MAEPENLILVHLREIRIEMKEGFGKVDQRFDKLEKRIENIKQAAFGESVLGRYAAAEVEERLEQIEKRLEALEGRS
jgi:tetrahydromethanopterin S-methyltransferase subunit G